jgi:hypothetical protein
LADFDLTSPPAIHSWLRRVAEQPSYFAMVWKLQEMIPDSAERFGRSHLGLACG